MTLRTNNTTPKRHAWSKWIAAGIVATTGAGLAVDAAAQSNVQIYGLVGTYIGSVKRSDNVARTTLMGSGGLTTSYIGFRGKEDLGGGTSAIFQLENFFQPDNGGGGRNNTDPTGFSRSAWVGLRGDFGQVSMGRHTTPYYLAMQAVNPFKSSVVFSPLVVQSYVASFGNTLIGDTVWDNAVQYAAPKIGGVSFTAIHAFGEKAGANAVSNTGLNLQYSGGPLVAVLSAQRVRTVAVAPSTGEYAVLGGLSYDFGPVKAYASAQGTDNAVTDIKSRTYQLGASVPVTASGSVLASWARTSVDNPKAATIRRNTGALGYDYFLSKRTDVYAVVLHDKASNKSAGNTYGLGIRHTF